ncbi:hypothetical protein HPB49_010476 [Dermacentor silvarum]|uniref:Uncharacterized protein n=1 Tax=Dermacentor silvarum TaxID=543639 RepID=A0ACB8C8X6_DERSI|nr:hypothetical protein HPB49_010476 [Dermacentor silvarum]
MCGQESGASGRCCPLEFRFSPGARVGVHGVGRVLLQTSDEEDLLSPVPHKPDEKGDHCSETMGDRVMEMPDFSDKKSNVQLDLETCNLKPSGEDTVTSESAANEEIMISDSMDQHPEKPQECSKEETVSKSEMTAHVPKKGLGADPNKPKCRKARDIRRERKLLKLSSAGKDLSPGGDKAPLSSKKPKNEPKSLEDFLFEPLPPDAAHKLEVRLVWNSPDCPEFAKSFDSALAVYFRYQEKIHKDSPEKLTERRYRRFLVNSPIQVRTVLSNRGSPEFEATFEASWKLYEHYQTRVHKEPASQCDRESYCQFLVNSPLQGNFSPSRLLCPETYTWHPIEKCKPLLDANKYCRFEQDPNKGDENAVQDLDEVSILYNRTVITYKKYCRLKGNADKAEVKEYANLVGKKCIKRLFLYRKS